MDYLQLFKNGNLDEFKVLVKAIINDLENGHWGEYGYAAMDFLEPELSTYCISEVPVVTGKDKALGKLVAYHLIVR